MKLFSRTKVPFGQLMQWVPLKTGAARGQETVGKGLLRALALRLLIV